jgi:hypothetical protein
MVLVTGMSGTGKSSALAELAEVILERVGVLDTNDYGKTDTEGDWVLGDLASIEPLLRAGATAEIDTRAPLSEVVGELERIAPGELKAEKIGS